MKLHVLNIDTITTCFLDRGVIFNHQQILNANLGSHLMK